MPNVIGTVFSAGIKSGGIMMNEKMALLKGREEY
jgi:hypothetical protein